MDATSSPLVLAAERTARMLLAQDRGRVAHSAGVARAAAIVGRRLDVPTQQSLVAAAWLHDIGHAPTLSRTGFHPLDGALHLARSGWPDVVVRLVAHHSHAQVLAPHYDAADHLAVLDPVPGPAGEILTFADLVAGSDGRGSTIDHRIIEMRLREAGDATVPLGVREFRYRLLAATARRVMRSAPADLLSSDVGASPAAVQ
jgi:hypothetical protein